MRGPTRIVMAAAVAVCIFALAAASASADRNQFYTAAGETQLLPDAEGQPAASFGVAGFGYPIELVNSGNLKLEALGGLFKNECTEGEIDTYLNKNSEAANLVEAVLVAGQFECENYTILATPSAAKAVFAAAALEATVTGLKFVVETGATGATKCEFVTPVAGVKGVWVNKGAVVTEEELGSTLTFTKVKLTGVTLAGTCPAEGELTAKFGVETYLQTAPAQPFDTEQVFYGT
jgi:hypothetical protein